MHLEPTRTTSWPGLTARDRDVLVVARRKLPAAPFQFEDAVRALREAVEASIPSDLVLLLPMGQRGPVIGSLVSSVGFMDSPRDVRVVRVRAGHIESLGYLE